MVAVNRGASDAAAADYQAVLRRLTQLENQQQKAGAVYTSSTGPPTSYPFLVPPVQGDRYDQTDAATYSLSVWWFTSGSWTQPAP